ncbi:hypothetical protein DNH61_07625 [Paenibacillus sambharensis]|uniref:DUF5808 domain-containing protein n=1 Tax=Paenibacillus sambharensis TaxID=1803190 RepID=A0A2W1LPC3_9BACL|nr:DUF5808 domain-containing protein [Paenibacillus sambharensis]PZD96374.1 hypothetical protein DNH61_07625 [Paenibacillus sambharensis]
MTAAGSWISFSLLYAIMIIVFVTLPFFSPRNIIFGISIPDKHADHQAMHGFRLRYIWSVIVAGILWAILIIALSLAGLLEELPVDNGISELLIVTSVIGYILIASIIFIVFHGQVSDYKRQQGWSTTPPMPKKAAADLKFRSSSIVYSNYWFLPHLLVTLLGAGAALALYDRIPDEIGMRYSIEGEVLHSAEKTVHRVLLLNYVQLAVIGVFIFLNYTIRSLRQKLDPSAPAESRKQEIRYRRSMSLLMISLGFLLVVYFALLQAMTLYGGNMKLAGSLAVLFPLLTVAVIGAAGFRIQRKRGKEGADGQDHHWKGGMLYYNPADPALIVEKRVGVGWTINFARPVSWLIIASFILTITVIIILS